MTFAANKTELTEPETPYVEAVWDESIPSNVRHLLQMLTYRRPHQSQGEADWVDRFIMPYRPTALLDPKVQPAAYMVDVAKADGSDPTVIFSSHVDTVHRDDKKQQIQYDPSMLMVYKDDGTPLGADDGAGVWLMLQMIDANVPGRYLFHRGEEVGCVGSKVVAKHHKDIFEGIVAAVAFDRKSDCSVITHQRMGRCCSDVFATALATRLSNLSGFTLAPDDGGVFTDTAEYTDLVGECTNVSIGYIDEHGPKEMLDVQYLLALREACVNPLTWDDLPSVRKPGEREEKSWGGYGGYYGGYYGSRGRSSNDNMSWWERELADEEAYYSSPSQLRLVDKTPRTIGRREAALMSDTDLAKWVKDSDPMDVAELIRAITEQTYEFSEEIDELYVRIDELEEQVEMLGGDLSRFDS